MSAVTSSTPIDVLEVDLCPWRLVVRAMDRGRLSTSRGALNRPAWGSPSGALADGTGPRRHRPAAAQDRNGGAQPEQVALRAESHHLTLAHVDRKSVGSG